MSDDALTRTAAPERLGRYELVRKLGQGGMGEVYLAQDTKLDRRVAIKVLPPHAVNDPDAVARFQREAKALAQLGHPGIVQAHDSDAVDERHFLVMEYVDGASLSEVLKQKGRVPPPQAADYVHQAALALQHAHDKGLVHRDLKPSNLLLTSDGRVKLLDLGLARFLQDQIADPGLTREHTGMGTPDYAAPEQFRDAHKADARSDIYALGCTLYHLLTGQVPFPGSSMQEKCRAHEHKVPAPIKELCPDAPVGLIAAVEKMMAKKPDDRYPSAKAAAEALAPYVGASSVCFDALMTTRTWQVAPPTMPMFPRRRSLLPWVGGAVAGMTVALLALLVFWPPPEPEQAPGPFVQATDKGTAKGTPGTDKGTAGKGTDRGPESQDPPKKQEPVKDEQPKQTAWVEPDVLTVAQDGSAQYASINDALADAKAGQTIRVLDDKEYQEIVILNRPVAMENLTLEAVRGARLLTTQDRKCPLIINGVAGVTVRGFRLKATGKHTVLIMVHGRCPGLCLEHLELETKEPSNTGIEVYALGLPDDAPPAVIRRCTFRGFLQGVTLYGKTPVAGKVNPSPVRRVLIQDNSITACRVGVYLVHYLERVQVVGNRIHGALVAGVQLEHLDARARDLLLANNTLVGCTSGVRVWDDAIHGNNFRVCNNLILDCPVNDLLILDSGGKVDFAKGPGDGAKLAQLWHFHHNWRTVGNPDDKEDGYHVGRVPPGPTDKRVRKLTGISDDPKSRNYLRPDAGSAIATEGAGQTDPSLPSYVGALPPPGQPAWDWSRTWLAPPPGVLLTVSKDEKAGGKYRTLNDALKDAKPWATIRVLDAETYEERVVLDEAKKYEGLVLEAPAGATVLMKGAARKFWEIQDVPHVRLRGFHFRSEGAKFFPSFITVGGATRGVVLERLTLTAGPKDEVSGILLLNTEAPAPGPPLVVRGCRMSLPGECIVVRAPVGAADGSKYGGVAIHDNDLADAFRGIYVTGKLANVQLSCNRVWHCRVAGLQTEGGEGDLRAITVVNNTVHDARLGWRFWLHGDGQAPAGQVALLNNLVSDVGGTAFLCIRQPTTGKLLTDTDTARAVPQLWQMAGNWVDNNGEDVRDGIPAAAVGHVLQRQPFRSTKPGHADFLRPTAELYSQMAAAAPPLWLPPYAGAVPPEGVELWDWERYWKWR